MNKKLEVSTTTATLVGSLFGGLHSASANAASLPALKPGILTIGPDDSAYTP